MSSAFQPEPPTPVDPDDALADLEATFQEASDPPEVLVIEEPPPPIGRSYALDFTSGSWQFASVGAPLPTRGLTTLIYWMEKCLRTDRGAHPIHPPEYGLTDPKSLIGQIVGQLAPVAELEQRIRDALTYHPRIVDIEDFASNFDSADEWVAVSFTVVLDDDTRLPLAGTVGATSATLSEF